jgi:hypothetical protein
VEMELAVKVNARNYLKAVGGIVKQEGQCFHKAKRSRKALKKYVGECFDAGMSIHDIVELGETKIQKIVIEDVAKEMF